MRPQTATGAAYNYTIGLMFSCGSNWAVAASSASMLAVTHFNSRNSTFVPELATLTCDATLIPMVRVRILLLSA